MENGKWISFRLLVFRMFIFLRWTSVWFMALNHAIDVYKLAPHYVKIIKWWSDIIGIRISETQQQRHRKQKSCLLTGCQPIEYAMNAREDIIQVTSNVSILCVRALASVCINMYDMRSTGNRNKQIQRDVKIYKRFRNGGALLLNK